jgi:hypothetical protein
MNEALSTHLNRIAAYLSYGYDAHRKTANDLRIGYSPKPDISYIAKAGEIDVSTFELFKAHFQMWMEREDSFLKSITAAIGLMRDEDIDVYNKLCNLAVFVKNERIRAKWVLDGLAWMDWNRHHIAVESKWLHDYFEKDWKPGEPIDFNIG